jgi:hypothetical protein
MVYIALKDFIQAHDFLKLVCTQIVPSLRMQVITAPGSACSAIQLEAYKKFILVSLIVNGTVSSYSAF